MSMNISSGFCKVMVLGVAMAAGIARAHTETQTNEVLRLMLEDRMARVCIDPQTGATRAVPLPKQTAAEFFSGDADWTAEDRQGAFDWYLANLSTTARRNGPFVLNPMASSAVRQCMLMGYTYTNAVSALRANALGPDDGCRKLEIQAVVMLGANAEEIVAFAGQILTNECSYSATERFACFRALNTRIGGIGGLGGADANLRGNVLALCYALRKQAAFGRQVDEMLCLGLPGYDMSSNRLDAATAALAEIDSLPSGLRINYTERNAYFSTVTNQLHQAVQPLPEVEGL